MSKVYKPRFEDATKEELIGIVKIYDELYREKTGRSIQKDANIKIKERKGKLSSSINRIIGIWDIPNYTFYKPTKIRQDIIERLKHIDNVVKKAYLANEFNSNLGRDGILPIVKEIDPSITLKQIRTSKVRLKIFSTKYLIKHRRPAEDKDINANVPNILDGITKTNIPLQIFSSDTTCMKTIGAPKEWSWACATIDLCSKFVFGANVSYFNDEKLVNKTYIETQFHSGSIINTDHGRNHLSYLNRELLKKLKVFISAGRVGKLNIFEIAERQNVFIKLKQN